MLNKSEQLNRGLLLLLLLVSLFVSFQSLHVTAWAASSTTAASSATSDESIDDWMPDKALQQAVYDALHDASDAHQTHGGNLITSTDQITKAMLPDIINIPAPNVKITDLTGLQYATSLQQFDFSGSTIEKAPGDDTSRSWSIFAKAKYSNLGTVDASSSDIDLKGLTTLPPNSTKANGGVAYTLENGDPTVAMPNLLANGTATQVTDPKNVTYDNANLSTMKAYIPLANWYKGFLTADGTYEYGSNPTAYPSQDGVTMDMPNHRLVVDLNTWGGKELTIPDFDIKDEVPNDQMDDDGTTEHDGNAHYYSDGNTLDATIPMFVTPTAESQTVKFDNLSSRTGTLDVTKFGFDNTDDFNWTIKSGDLTSNDISFTLGSNNQISFTLTDTGYQKLMAGDLKSEIMFSTGDKIGDLTLSLEEPSTTWMPDPALRTQLQKILTADGLGDLTKANLAKLTELSDSQKLTGISDLKGLEYAKNLTSLKITNSPDLVVLKTGNSQVLSQLTALASVEIDDSSLGGTLAGWGLDNRSELNSLTATNDSLTEFEFGELTGDTGLTKLNLSSNTIAGTLPDLSSYPALQTLYLNDNHFTGEIPASWSKLQSLQKLNLSQNDDASEYQLSGSLETIASLTNLSDVNLNYNNLNGSLPASWFTSKLTSFQAINNDFTGDLPDLSKAVNLTTMAYGANQITSGTTMSGASGNYQSWSITDPDWQTSQDGRTMTLDLGQYYHGEPGQDYRYLGIDMNGGTQTGITLNKTDPAHPLLTIDTANTNLTNGNFTFNLFDQAGKQASNGDMNYLATVTVPVTLAIPKTYAIDTGSDTGSEATIDFGSPKVGAGMVPANNFKLGVSSTNAAGDAYQLTAQTDGLTANDRTLPLYYGSGQHQTLLTNAPQSIYDYQPTTNDGSETVVGDSQDDTKGNLHTDVPATAYTGTYKGTVTYTLASAPAEDATTAAQDADLTKISSLSGLSPTLSGLDATNEATRAGLEKNMTSFVKTGLADADGVLYSSYKAGQNGGSYEELSETTGLWLLALANQGDTADFDTAFTGVVKRFYDSDKGIFNWQSEGADHTITQGSASIDDLRIIQALLIMNQKDPGNNDRVTWIKNLMNGFTKYDLNAYYQMVNGYNSNGQEKRIRLDYLDLATLKAVYEAKGLYDSGNTAGETAYQQQLKLIKDSYISDQFPFFATYYDYSTGNYQVAADASEDSSISEDHINITDGLLTMLNLAKVGELPQASLNWLKANTADRHIYNNYKLDGTPIAETDAPSNYGYVAQIAAAVGDTELYSQALTVMNSMTSTDTTSPLYGSTAYDGESYAFNDLNMLLGYTSVISTNS